MFEGLSPEALQAKQPSGATVSFLADETTLTDPEHPILAVRVLPPQDFEKGDYRPFRVVPAQLSSVENNVNEVNLDWEAFADKVDADGIYRREAVSKESDFELNVRSIMAERLAHLSPGVAESIRNAESPDGMAGMAIISPEEDPQSVREQLTSLRSYPAALPWDWFPAFDADHANKDRADYLKAFLSEIGEHAFAHGAVLASLSSGEDYYLVFVTPPQFDELSRLFTAHGMRAETVRRGWRMFTPEQSAAVRAWGKAFGGKVTARGRAMAESPGAPEKTEPNRLDPS
ncbi:hypothetical protein AB0N05_32400 [Nocardia sp. NPDC051030]|uniref:DUF6630 family protein n=1 Tax=Nocardia sp. NPDC051030 TaxID=3155162 RepID=UPI00342EE1F2